MSRAPRRAALLAVGLALVLVAPASVSATHSWGGYHWARTANPFTVKLVDNVSSVWDPILLTTSGDWTQSAVLNTTIVSGSAARVKQCRASAGTVQVCNATYGNNGWLGVASISITGGTHITQATVKLNDTYFNTSTYNTPAWRNMVMCQEVGHAFGLDHQDTNFTNANLNTCMDYTNNPTSNQQPNQHDYDELVSIYSHLDATSTLASATTSKGGPAGNAAPAAWGRLVAVTNGGHGATYLLDLGAGNLVLTHVLWAGR